MSTVVDNNKYIINGSTLSDIGDAIRGQMSNPYETVTEDAVCYRWTYSVNGSRIILDLTEKTIQEWYQNTLPSPITKVKIINTENEYSNYSAYVEVNGQREDLTLNKSYTYSLPITISGSSPSYTTNDYTFKIYPLNGDNYLSWDSNYYYPSSSRDYDAHLYKEKVSYERLLPKPKFLVSDIAQKITEGTLETWRYLCTNLTYVDLPADFSIENLKDVFFRTSTSRWDACGLYKSSVGKPVSLKDQGIALPSSYSGMNSPVTQAKIVTAYNEGRIFSIPWLSKDFGNNKIIPDKTSFCWVLVEPADSKIYVGAGRYINYTGIGYWTVVYTK